MKYLHEEPVVKGIHFLELVKCQLLKAESVLEIQPNSCAFWIWYFEKQGAEDLRKELEKKYALYRNQDTNGEDQVVIDKMRANIKMLQTQMLVSIQAVDGAAIEIQKLRDDDLYPQLLDLLEG